MHVHYQYTISVCVCVCMHACMCTCVCASLTVVMGFVCENICFHLPNPCAVDIHIFAWKSSCRP